MSRFWNSAGPIFATQFTFFLCLICAVRSVFEASDLFRCTSYFGYWRVSYSIENEFIAHLFLPMSSIVIASRRANPNFFARVGRGHFIQLWLKWPRVDVSKFSKPNLQRSSFAYIMNYVSNGTFISTDMHFWCRENHVSNRAFIASSTNEWMQWMNERMNEWTNEMIEWMNE